MENRKCSVCGGEFEEGLVVDRGDYSIPMPQKWVNKIKLLTLKDDSRQVKTYRCKNCGYLESYAK